MGGCGGLYTAAAADAGYPFDAHPVADLDAGELGAGAELGYRADALVAADLARRGGEWEALPLRRG